MKIALMVAAPVDTSSSLPFIPTILEPNTQFSVCSFLLVESGFKRVTERPITLKEKSIFIVSSRKASKNNVKSWEERTATASFHFNPFSLIIHWVYIFVPMNKFPLFSTEDSPFFVLFLFLIRNYRSWLQGETNDVKWCDHKSRFKWMTCSRFLATRFSTVKITIQTHFYGRSLLPKAQSLNYTQIPKINLTILILCLRIVF